MRQPGTDIRGVSQVNILHVERLVQCALTVQRLKDTQWYSHLPNPYSVHLDPPSFAAVMLHLYENASSGVLIARNRHAQSHTVAFAAGSAVATATDTPELQLGTYLLDTGTLDPHQAHQAAHLMQSESKPLGWALLQLGLMSVEHLLQAQQAHVEHCLHHLLAGAGGTITFFETAAAMDLHRIIETPTLAILRQSAAHVYRQSRTTLQSFTAPLFERSEPLQWRPPTERAAPLVADIAPLIADIARQATPARALGDAIAAQPEAQQARLLADVYWVSRWGFLGFAGGAATVHLATIPTDFHGHSDAALPADPMQLYRHQEEQLALGKRQLNAFEAAAAVQTLRAVVTQTVAPGPLPAAVAYLAIAYALTGDAAQAMHYATQNLQGRPHDALAHAAMSRAMQVAGSPAKANYHGKTALGLAQKDLTWFSEIQTALTLAARVNDRPRAQGPRDGWAVTLWVLTGATLMGLFALAIIFRMGSREYFYDPRDIFFYVRRGVLLVGGWAGLCAWQQQNPLAVWRQMPWRLSRRWVQPILWYGIIIGLASPLQRVGSPFGVVALLSLLHVVCEEVFFRGLLTRLLLDQISEERLALLVSGIFYGAYHMTYYSFWVESGWEPRLYYMGLIAAFAGVPYAWLYARSRSLTAPLLCHTAVSLAMMGKSCVVKLNYFGLHLS